MGSFRKQIGDGYWLVAGWAQSSRAYAPAEASTIDAVLVAEVTVVAGGALINGAVSRRAGWDRWKRSRVSTPPLSMTRCRRVSEMSLESGQQRGAQANAQLLDQADRWRQQVGQRLAVARRMDDTYAFPAEIQTEADAIEQKAAIELRGLVGCQGWDEPRFGPPWLWRLGHDEQRTPHRRQRSTGQHPSC